VIIGVNAAWLNVPNIIIINVISLEIIGFIKSNGIDKAIPVNPI
jgi:hypothetical protein